MTARTETRNQRYQNKQEKAIHMPVSLVTVNFDFDDNLAFLIRTAACYGAANIYVIGSIPSRSVINSKSGSLMDYINLVSFSNPSKFLQFTRDNEIKLVSAELADQAISIHNYKFNFGLHTAIVFGNETTGVPVEIMMNSDIVYIPMPGVGFCLNTSQTGTAFMHEYTRQFNDWSENDS